MKSNIIDPFVLDIEIDEQGAIKNIKDLSSYFQLYDYRNVLYNRFEKDKDKTIDDMFNSQLFDDLLPQGSYYIYPIWKQNPMLATYFHKNFVHTLKYTIIYRREQFVDEHDFIVLNYYSSEHKSLPKTHRVFNKKIIFTRYSEQTLIDKLFKKELSIKDLIRLNNNYILIHHIYRGYPDYININELIKHYKEYKNIKYAQESSHKSTINCKYYFDREEFYNNKSLLKYQDAYLDGYLQCLLNNEFGFFNYIEFVVPNDKQGLRFMKRKRAGCDLLVYDTVTANSGKVYYLCQRQSNTFYISTHGENEYVEESIFEEISTDINQGINI